MPKCKYLWLVQKSKMASKNMKPFLAEVLAKTKGGEHLWRAFQVHWKKFSKPELFQGGCGGFSGIPISGFCEM